jgi:hypothetical protein
LEWAHDKHPGSLRLLIYGFTQRGEVTVIDQHEPNRPDQKVHTQLEMSGSVKVIQVPTQE